MISDINFTAIIVFVNCLEFEFLNAQSTSTLQNSGKLVYSIVLFRHGDREPGELPPGIDNTNIWTTADSELTQAGMRRSYRLGKYLRLRYNNFLSDKYIKNQIYVRSTDMDRTLMTASSLLAGLYPPKGKQKWHPNIDWQPIPIHTKLLDKDPSLKPSKYDCPTIDKWRDRHDDPVWKRLAKEPRWRPLVEFLSRNVSPVYKKLKKVKKLFNPLVAMRNHRVPWPRWMNNTLMDQITAAKNLYNQMKYDDRTEHKLAGGILTGDILSNIKKKIKDNLPEKLRLYSAHSGTLTPQLQNLGIYNGLPPPFSAAIFFEVYKVHKLDSRSSDHYVNVFYRNETDTVQTPLYSMNLPNCHPRECTLQKFQRSLYGKYYTKEDKLATACGRDDDNSSADSSDDDES